jgi:hypothetical protein
VLVLMAAYTARGTGNDRHNLDLLSVGFYIAQNTCDECYEYIQCIVRALVKVGEIRFVAPTQDSFNFKKGARGLPVN